MRIGFYATLRKIVGEKYVELALPEPCTLQQILDAVVASYPELAEEILRRAQRAHLRAVPTGIEHGTVTAVSGTQTYQITTLRRDVKTDGRRAEVVLTDAELVQQARDAAKDILVADPSLELPEHFGLKTSISQRQGALANVS